MFTPQQIDQISFDRAVFGGYDMQSVDDFLEPLLQDYETLYKENATLKSKMRVLVEKLEEYRKNESSVREALVAAQRTCDSMVREAEAKCVQMLHEAQSQKESRPAESSRVEAQMAAERQRLEQARAEAGAGIAALESQLREILQKLEALRTQQPPQTKAEPAPSSPQADAPDDEVAKEIAQNLEKLVGPSEDAEPVPAIRPLRTESSTTSRFANLQFGKNYDPTKR